MCEKKYFVFSPLLKIHQVLMKMESVMRIMTQRWKILKTNFERMYLKKYLIRISLHLSLILREKRNKLHYINSLLQWLLYFLLIWQSICHISNNGLAWLLKFLFQIFWALNVHVSNSVIEELIAVFPTLLYMLRQFPKLDRDDFTKYVVCPKCYKCYEYGECLVERNGHSIAKLCSNKLYSRGKAHV